MIIVFLLLKKCFETEIQIIRQILQLKKRRFVQKMCICLVFDIIILFLVKHRFALLAMDNFFGRTFKINMFHIDSTFMFAIFY